ncbi:MAG: hypothetical protein AB7U85_09915 [Alphaproteobacteria bacterium]
MKKLLVIIISLSFISCSYTKKEEFMFGGIGGAVGGGIAASLSSGLNLPAGALIGYVAGGAYQAFRHRQEAIPACYKKQMDGTCIPTPQTKIAAKKIIMGVIGGAALGGGIGAALSSTGFAAGALMGGGLTSAYLGRHLPTETVITCGGRLDVKFARPSPWNGTKIPGAQVCQRDGGNGATPPLVINKIPQGTNAIIVEFNDLDNIYLSHGGGNGKIGYYHNGSTTAWLLPVQGETTELPPYAFIEQLHRGRSARGTAYLPPCSSGNNHLYVADVVAVHRSGEFEGQRTEVLARGNIVLGRY